MKRATILLLVIILITLVSCSSFNNNDQPNNRIDAIPTSEFISNVRVANFSNANYSFKKAVCITVNQKALWEINNKFDKLDDHLKATLRVSIDNKPLILVTLSVPQIAVFHGVYSDDGKELGTYEEPFEACFDISDISIGVHSALVHIESLSGVEHRYSWNIEIQQG